MRVARRFRLIKQLGKTFSSVLESTDESMVKKKSNVFEILIDIVMQQKQN